MPDALIGHTGFVGSNLARQRTFTTAFNSRNIESIHGRHFDDIVCAGVSAVKWLANKEPEADWQGICRLTDSLELVTAEHFTLISTIDVYRDPVRLTERDRPSSKGLHAYGRHRLALEAFVAERFPSHTIVRLPALFGMGLKKNALFDLMTRNMTDRIVPNASFQWYPLRRLEADLTAIRAAGIDLINLTAEPITMGDITDRFFPGIPVGAPVATAPRYDVRSLYANVLGGKNGYHLDAMTVWDELAAFLARPS
jgi:nucleoside-diphosphate-sugar epimerase